MSGACRVPDTWSLLSRYKYTLLSIYILTCTECCKERFNLLPTKHEERHPNLHTSFKVQNFALEAVTAVTAVTSAHTPIRTASLQGKRRVYCGSSELGLCVCDNIRHLVGRVFKRQTACHLATQSKASFARSTATSSHFHCDQKIFQVLKFKIVFITRISNFMKLCYSIALHVVSSDR